MRERLLIESDGARKDILTLEVLLDCRSLLEKLNKEPHKRKTQVSKDKNNIQRRRLKTKTKSEV